MHSSRTSSLIRPVVFAGTKRVRHTMRAGEHAVIFHTLGRDSKADIDVTLKPKSSLIYIFLSEGKGARLRSTIGTSAQMTWHCITIGAKESVYDLQSNIIGQGGVSQVNWVFRAGKKDKQTIDIHNIFSAKNGGGEIVLKGVAEDQAQVVCNGMIKIGLQGGGTKTHLTEDVLMLDSTAKVDAIPGLEIKTNDVKASHSATVSRVAPEQLFYLQSRGLPEETARKLFIDGFLSEMIGRIEQKNIAQEVRAALL